MKLKLSRINSFSKKKKILLIITSILFVIFSISGGYLLWRVSQPETIAPEDIDAFESIICYGDGVNENRINTITTYNIKNGGLPYDVGPFPKGARVVLYYKSLESSNYRPKIRFSYGGKNYDYIMPVLNSSKRGVVQTNIVISNENDKVKLVYSDDNFNQGNPSCNPGDTKYRSFGWMPVKNNMCGSGFPGPPTQYVPFEKKSVSSDIQWANSFGNPIVSRQCWGDWREWLGDYDFNDYFLQIGYIEPVIPDPLCGTNAGTIYEYTQTEWPTSGTFCEEGEADPTNPVFPASGSTTEWECTDGTKSVSCEASRLEPDPLCGTYDGSVYQHTQTSWPSDGTFCEEGEPDPSNPEFPLVGTMTEWHCISGSGSVSCEVARLEPEPVCGTYDGWVYPYTQTDWPSDGTFCAEGEPDPSNPVFPLGGAMTEWECANGMGNVTCQASRLEPDPVCGTYNGSVYEHTQTEWPTGGTFCTEGSVEPSKPLFPEEGSATDWKCTSGSKVLNCRASRLQFREPQEVVEQPVIVVPQTPTVEKIPETGIFNDVEKPVLVGGILLLLGLTWSWIGRGMYVTINFLGRVHRKILLSVRDIKESISTRRRNNQMRKDSERKKKFEKRVGKRI